MYVPKLVSHRFKRRYLGGLVGLTLVLVVVRANVIVLVLIILLVRILIANTIAFVIVIWCLVLALTDNKEADL